jgi:tetratricopeptide (TPR) repeat protein
MPQPAEVPAGVPMVSAMTNPAGAAAAATTVVAVEAGASGLPPPPSGLASTLPAPADPPSSGSASWNAHIPQQIGAYRLLRALGSGGMGQVWLAERSDGVYRQQVAIKVMASALGDPDAIARAAAERQFLATLEHPGITRLIDGGATPAGQPYVVMEYVPGVPIDVYCRHRHLDIVARVRLLIRVMDAVAAAHRALVVHRDLKPANIYVTEAGEVKLLDFGIAKALGSAAAGRLETQPGLSPMTPAYASPEQLLGKPITTATDVYALGVVLHELLTGVLPYAATHNLAQLVSEVSHGTLRAVSTRVDVAALGIEASQRRRWQQLLRGDLDRIVATALQLDPAQRYASVGDFAADLQRWLAHEPVLARAGGGLYRLRKWLRRHRLAAVSGATVAMLLVGLVWGLFREREQARTERDSSRALLTVVTRMVDVATTGINPGQPITPRDVIADTEARLLAGEFDRQPLVKADLLRILATTYRGISDQQRSFALAEQRLTLLEQTPGAPLDALADAHSQVAFGEFMRGDLGAARPRIEEAVAALERLGRERPAGVLLTAYLVQSYVANAESRREDAVRALRRAVALEPELPATEYTDLATAHGLLIATLGHAGRLQEADRQGAASLAWCAAHLPADSSSVAFVTAQHANVLGLLGEFAAAERGFSKAEVIFRTKVGENFLWRADFLRLQADSRLRAALARDDRSAGLREAEAAAREANRIYRATIGEGYVYYPQMRRTLGMLACLGSDPAQQDEGLIQLQRAIADEAQKTPQNALWLGLAEAAYAQCALHLAQTRSASVPTDLPLDPRATAESAVARLRAAVGSGDVRFLEAASVLQAWQGHHPARTQR